LNLSATLQDPVVEYFEKVMKI